MKNPEQRINNIIGQLEGVKKMITNNHDCFLILNQIKSLKSAVSSLGVQLLSDELGACLSNKMEPSQRKKMETILKELIKN